VSSSVSLKLHASRWAKIFRENQYCEKCTKLLRKVKTFKIQVIFYMLCAINTDFAVFYHHISTVLLMQWALFLHNYVDHFLVISKDCKCRLQYVNYFVFTKHNRALDNFWGQVPIPSGRGILRHFKTKRGILSQIQCTSSLILSFTLTLGTIFSIITYKS
jgi:hypothetical protein